MSKTTAFITMVLLSMTIMVRTAYADPNDDLKAQVKTLNGRVAQLEQQLADKNNPAVPASGISPTRSVWDPYAEMQRMQAQMNQMFQDSFDRGFGPWTSALAAGQADLKETPDAYIITMDLPGMDKDKINVEVKNGMLIVSGERSAQSQVSGNQYSRQERSFGNFSRAIALPNGAKPDDVKADYKNGVLEIRVGRLASDKPANAGKKILVN